MALILIYFNKNMLNQVECIFSLNELDNVPF